MLIYPAIGLVLCGAALVLRIGGALRSSHRQSQIRASRESDVPAPPTSAPRRARLIARALWLLGALWLIQLLLTIFGVFGLGSDPIGEWSAPLVVPGWNNAGRPQAILVSAQVRKPRRVGLMPVVAAGPSESVQHLVIQVPGLRCSKRGSAALVADRESSGNFELELGGQDCEAVPIVRGVSQSQVAESVTRLLQQWRPEATEVSNETARRQVGALIQQLANGADLRTLIDPSAPTDSIRAGCQVYSIGFGPAIRETVALYIFTLAAIAGMFVFWVLRERKVPDGGRG